MNRHKGIESEAVVRLYHEGLPFREIATRLGVHYTTVRYHVVNSGLPTRRPRTAWNKGIPWDEKTREAHNYRATPEYRKACSDRQRQSEKKGEVRRLPWNWADIRKKCYQRDNWTCQNCGVKCLNSKQAKNHPHLKIQAHHIIPRREGGTDDLTNLTTLCSRCHGSIEGLSVGRREQAA